MIYEVKMAGRKDYVLYENKQYLPIKVGMIIEKKDKKYIVKKITKKGLRLKKYDKIKQKD